jgi:hypothetical protein
MIAQGSVRRFRDAAKKTWEYALGAIWSLSMARASVPLAARVSGIEAALPTGNEAAHRLDGDSPENDQLARGEPG